MDTLDNNIFTPSKEERNKSKILEQDQVRKGNEKTNEHIFFLHRKIRSFSLEKPQ